MNFDDLIAPITRETFFSKIFGQRPLHIPAPEGSVKAAMLGWKDLSGLMGIRAHWDPSNLKVVLNSQPIAPEFYLSIVQTLSGPQMRADPAKLDIFVAMGASIVANALEEVAPALRSLCDSLADAFGGRAGVNAYASFEGVQAFPSHCDLHEVFALQCDGEKTWRLYQNPALNPVDTPDAIDAQARIDAEKGPLVAEVRTRPGDVLYLPRGWYHDALATSAQSLHLSFAVWPLYGRAIFSLLEAAAMRDPEFRAYLPDGRQDAAALATRLDALGARLADLVRMPSFSALIVNRQRELATRAYPLAWPERLTLEYFMRLDMPASLVRDGDQPLVRTRGGSVPVERGLEEAAEWLLQRPAFSVQELSARFRHLPQDSLRTLVSDCARSGLLRAYTPEL